MLQLAASRVFAADVAKSVPSETNSGASISDVYSDIDMRMRLATKMGASACQATQCEENREFDARVGAIGSYLSKTALALYPQQEKVIMRMVFSVVDKQEAGTASNNKGQIVVLRGVQYLQLSDDALGFVIAREMAHVMAGHHATNTSTKLIISALVSVLFPAVAIIGASSAAAQASTATTLITSAASTATSMVGSEVVMAKMKPTQLHEADEIARAIMENTEWDMRSVESVLMQDEPSSGAWMIDLQASRTTLQAMIEKEDAEIVPLVDEEIDLTQENIDSAGEVSAEANAEATAEDNLEIIPDVVVVPLSEAVTQ